MMACGRSEFSEAEDAAWVDLECEACEAQCRYESLEVGHSVHVEGGMTYVDLPPVGGDHDPCWAAWGVYEAEIGDENWVHNMEHGAVVFLYNCPEGCESEVQEMSTFVEEHWGHSLLSPYSLMESRFAVVAWGVRLVTECLDMDAMAQFYEIHVDHAPESTTSMPPEDCME
jgi:hypothetical protein